MKKIIFFISIVGLMSLEFIQATQPAGCIDSSSQGHPIVGAPCYCNDQIVFRQDCEWSLNQNCSNINCDE